MPSNDYLASTAGRADFVVLHDLWTDEQRAAASALDAQLESFEFVRVAYGDLHGIARSKCLTADVFRSVLRNGMDASPGPFVFDTGHAVAIDFFAQGGGLGISELTGAGDFIVVPDPLTFRTLPHAGRPCGWVIGDEYMRSGSPHPLSGRAVLRRLCERIGVDGLDCVVGLEVEWYLTRYTDAGRPGEIGGFGVQGTAPAVEPVDGGYQFNSDGLLDGLMPALGPVVDALVALDLPLRSIEHESGPGQLEFTFSPMDALAAADGMLMFRTVAKQVLARSGYHASFMALPGLPGFDPSGWHLHQSIAERATGRNVFAVPAGDDPLSEAGMRYLAGLLDHAAPASVLCVPTINGYRRMRTGFSLSPDRIGWCAENRGAFLRVVGGVGDPGSHIENRTGDPAANPYLYVAGQLSAGLDGIDRRLDPGPALRDAHDCAAPALPCTLAEALRAFADSTHYRALLGDALHGCIVQLKRSELARYGEWREGAGVLADDEVSEWEQREYFATF